MANNQPQIITVARIQALARLTHFGERDYFFEPSRFPDMLRPHKNQDALIGFAFLERVERRAGGSHKEMQELAIAKVCILPVVGV